MKSWFSFPKLASFSILLSLLVIISCKKENSQSGTDQQEEQVAQVSAEADAEAESTYSELFDDVMGVNNDVGVAGSGVSYGRIDTLTPVARCFTVSASYPNGTPFPVIITLDFGTTGCAGPDGRVRRGKIIIEYTARLINPGAIATAHFENFYVNDIHVEGTHRITNTSETNIPRRFRIEVINGKLTRPNGNYIEWSSTRVVTQIEGLSTPLIPRDDIFKIEGTAHGVTRRDNLLVRWESTITEPLIRRVSCRWIVKGRVRTVRVNLPNPGNSPWVGILDFGAGVCDDQATLTINGTTHQITLP